MADPHHPEPRRGTLDASGPREVVFCHQCENEWYRDEHGLECPLCGGEVTEIITPESDPRPIRPPSTPPEVRSLREHNPWPDSDPEEADIEEHITQGPGGSVLISRTIRSGPRVHPGSRRAGGPQDPNRPDDVMREFQTMLGTLMGPGFQQGQAGRSGPNDLFPPSPFGGGFRMDRSGLDGGPGPSIVGGRFTYTVGPGRPRNGDDAPPVDDLAAIITNIFGQMGRAGEQRGDGQPGVPMGIQGLLASIFNPANARHGDAVYSQEALDQIISTLMEQHPTSNAPGPASPAAIAALPKKKLDEEMLGPEGKGECSVCMDDVKIGDEVVSLPCSHWFHEVCAGMWLGEHNTCPICRKGIEGETSTAEGRRGHQSGPTATTTRNEHRAQRMSHGDRSDSGPSGSSPTGRNEARLNSIRSAAGVPYEGNQQPRRWHVVGDPNRNDDDAYAQRIPGAYGRRDSEMSDSQRDNRRGNESPRESRRSSQSGNGSGNGGTGAMAWLRDRFSRQD